MPRYRVLVRISDGSERTGTATAPDETVLAESIKAKGHTLVKILLSEELPQPSPENVVLLSHVPNMTNWDAAMPRSRRFRTPIIICTVVLLVVAAVYVLSGQKCASDRHTAVRPAQEGVGVANGQPNAETCAGLLTILGFLKQLDQYDPISPAQIRKVVEPQTVSAFEDGLQTFTYDARGIKIIFKCGHLSMGRSTRALLKDDKTPAQNNSLSSIVIVIDAGAFQFDAAMARVLADGRSSMDLRPSMDGATCYMPGVALERFDGIYKKRPNGNPDTVWRTLPGSTTNLTSMTIARIRLDGEIDLMGVKSMDTVHIIIAYDDFLWSKIKMGDRNDPDFEEALYGIWHPLCIADTIALLEML